jgi:hypothetical protein
LYPAAPFLCPELAGITELRVTAGTYNQIDNVDMEAPTNAVAVPLPGTLA